MGPTDVRETLRHGVSGCKYKPIVCMPVRTIMDPDNLSKPQLEFILALARTKNLTMSSLSSSSKDFNVAIVGGGMCGLAW